MYHVYKVLYCLSVHKLFFFNLYSLPHSSSTIMSYQISKKRKFVQDGVFKAELDEFLTRELAEDGYSGVEVSLNVKNAKTSFATSTNFYPFCV